MFLLVAFCLASCVNQTETGLHSEDKNHKTIVEESLNVDSHPQKITETISADMSIDVCIDYLGEKDEETGFRLSYRYINTVKIDGVTYHLIYRTWIVDESNPELSHPSFIGYAIVSANGDKIYDGKQNEMGRYELGEILWEQS